MKVSTGFRNHLLVTGSAKAALDGKVIRNGVKPHQEGGKQWDLIRTTPKQRQQ